MKVFDDQYLSKNEYTIPLVHNLLSDNEFTGHSFIFNNNYTQIYR